MEIVCEKYLSHDETKRAIVANLRCAFPGMKFSLRKSGGSISVRWTDGPTDREVRDKVGFIHNSGFDGMIDMSYYHLHYLDPSTGTIRYGGTDGTGSSGGSVGACKHEMLPGEVAVSVSNDHMNLDRYYSRAFLEGVVVPRLESVYYRKMGRDFGLMEGWDGRLYLSGTRADFLINRDIDDDIRRVCMESSGWKAVN